MALRLYFDEDVDVLLARLLAIRGFDCETAVDAGLLGRSDIEHLEHALSAGRVLVTHNRRDFEQLAADWWKQHRDHAGILLAVRRADAHDLMRHVLPVLTCYDQSGWRNVVMYA